MDRSFAARVAHPFAGPQVSRGRRASRAGGRGGSPLGLPLAGVSALAGALRRTMALVWQHRRARIALLTLLACMPLLAGGWLLLRRSPFVAVQKVRVAGVHGAQAGAIETALVGAAQRMSTLDVNTGALRAAVAGFPQVQAIRATPRFPHGLSISVVEQAPVAALVVGTSRTAVAADGAVLGPALASGTLPSVNGYRELRVGEHVRDVGLRGILTVLGAAPGPLERVIAKVYVGEEGLTLKMRNGLLAYFGDAGRPHAKWLSLARVLADPSSDGASYVDVRIPERPAAGFPAGVTPPAQSSTEAAPMTPSASSSEATVASIAATLAGSNNGVASPSSTPTTTSAAPAETTAEPAASPTTESAPSTEQAPESSTPGG